MEKYIKILILLAIVMYIISPVDIIPGPMDDVLLLTLGIAAQQKLTEKK